MSNLHIYLIFHKLSFIFDVKCKYFFIFSHYNTFNLRNYNPWWCCSDLIPFFRPWTNIKRSCYCYCRCICQNDEILTTFYNVISRTYPTTFVTATACADTVIFNCVSCLRKIHVHVYCLLMLIKLLINDKHFTSNACLF